MRLKSLHVVRFRRFVDLELRDLSPTAKLVVLAGPNGSGKSSLFDAIFIRSRTDSETGRFSDTDYYDRPNETQRDLGKRIQVCKHGGGGLVRNSVYVRTAYRNDHEFRTSSVSGLGDIVDQVTVKRFIEPDNTVSNNYQRLASTAIEDVFVDEKDETTFGDYREKVTGEIRRPLKRLFSDLNFVGFGNPLQQGSFRFDKGDCKGFDYKNLSGGEKAAFDLILDIVVKRKSYPNAVYCIDEPEVHMNTKLQGALLGELMNLLPDESQLWIASHSIGMMRKARELYDADPSSVTFLDFGDKDFDKPVVLVPSKPTRAFWQNVMHVALDDLAALVAPRHVIVCEGNPAGLVPGKNAEHDARVYTAIFADEMPDVVFISAGNSKEVAGDFLGLAAALPKLASGMKVTRLIDRDDHAPADMEEHRSRGVTVLSRRHLEAYLYDDEVLAALCRSVGRLDNLDALLAVKQTAISDTVQQGFPNDDIKKAAGTIYNGAKRILGLRQAGNDQMAFSRNTLAPLLKPGMAVYDVLKNDIFGV